MGHHVCVRCHRRGEEQRLANGDTRAESQKAQQETPNKAEKIPQREDTATFQKNLV